MNLWWSFQIQMSVCLCVCAQVFWKFPAVLSTYSLTTDKHLPRSRPLVSSHLFNPTLDNAHLFYTEKSFTESCTGRNKCCFANCLPHCVTIYIITCPTNFPAQSSVARQRHKGLSRRRHGDRTREWRDRYLYVISPGISCTPGTLVAER